MLPEKIYQKAATEFGTSVGVAKILGYKSKNKHIEEYTPGEFKSLSDQMDINWIISESILDGQYTELQREIYNLKKTNKRLKSELSIYKRAYDIINGKGNTNNTKPTKVHRTAK
jgi:cell shape-determining protein MreC